MTPGRCHDGWYQLLTAYHKTKTNSYTHCPTRITLLIRYKCILKYVFFFFLPFSAAIGVLKRYNISRSTPLVFISLVQSVGNMALARLGKCCRSLVHEPSKGVFCGVSQQGWIESCTGGERNKPRQPVSRLVHRWPLKAAGLETEKLH